MPNALLATVGSPGNPQTVSLPLFDPRLVREHRARFRRDLVPELDYANALYVASGRWPARGWVLLKRGDYNQITNLYRTDFQLQVANLLDDSVAPALKNVVPAGITFGNLAIVQARCVTRGWAADPDSVYLVELTDKQGVLTNPWAQWPTSSQYNCLAPAYPGGVYLNSTNSGVAWTWNTMAEDLWTQMPLMGPYPGLPITPLGTPENYVFTGEGAWDSLTHVLDYLGLTVSSDLTQTSPYGIVVPGAADALFAQQTSQFAPLLESDYEYIDSGAGRVPGGVFVRFHRVNQYYGTEETVRGDALQWQSTPTYTVFIAGPAPYSSSPGRTTLWADFAVRFDVDNNPLAADVAVAQAIAQERANQYYTRITRGTLGYLRRVYAGALPFTAGSQVDGVCWRQQSGRAAWRTEIVEGPQPPFSQLHVSLEGRA